MQNRLLPVSILVVGLAMACALLIGLTRIAEVFRYKDFYSSSSGPRPAQNVTTLQNNRFVVADSSSIYVYRVERNGKLVLESRADVGQQPDKGIGYEPISTVTPSL